MKKAKKARRRSGRSTVDLIALEGNFGKRLRALEAKLNITEPSEGISLAMVMCTGPGRGTWASPEGVHVGREGHVTGTYRLGQYRDVVFWGPRGFSLEETEAIHRAEVARMLTDPEYAEPLPSLKTPGEHSVRLHLGSGVNEVLVTGEPDPWAARSRGLLREVDGAVVIRSDNQP